MVDIASSEDILAAARRVLDEHARLAAETRTEWGVGRDDVVIIDDPSPDEEAADLERARRFQRAMYEAGLVGIAASAELESLFAEYDAPKLDTLLVSLRIVAPALARYSSGPLRDELLPALLKGEVIACQLFSEPDAGSDLAGVRTRAVRDGDEWVIAGQKVWTSNAQFSDVGLLLARTDPDVPKHRGLTMFVVDMHSPSVTVRPLRQMTGGAHFNEIFLDGVRVSDVMRVGDEGQGWQIALTTLMGERLAVGYSEEAPASAVVDRLVGLYRHTHLVGSTRVAVLKDEVLAAWMLGKVHELTNARLAVKAATGGGVGPEVSILKLMHNQVVAAATTAAGHLLGPSMIADTGEWGTFAWAGAVLSLPGLRLAGGTDEIQRNILGERVLGLPKEPGRA